MENRTRKMVKKEKWHKNKINGIRIFLL